MEETAKARTEVKTFPLHGWIGLSLAIIFWILNWSLTGLRTQWGFFPMWLGYCLFVDGLVVYRTGTSLLTRSWQKYVSLFLVSAPVWWLFELINLRIQNWVYEGASQFSPLAFAFWATLSFSTVVPAVFGTAELYASFNFIKKARRGPVIKATRKTTTFFFILGWAMLALMLAWPRYFFPFAWLSVYFILAPINVWLGNRSLTYWTRKGDWRPILALWAGVLTTGFFWEMWNYFSYPKWVYHVPFVNYFHIFEMPLLGYGGYLPFALELFAVYHFFAGLTKHKQTQYVKVEDL